MKIFSTIKNSQLTTLSFGLSIVVAVIAVLVLICWQFDLLYLIKNNGDQSIIKPNAGLCFLASAVSLLLLAKENTKKAGIAITFVVLVFNLINISQYLFNYHAGIDNIFLTDQFTPVVKNPGRMGLNTSIFFVFISLIQLSTTSGYKVKLAEILMLPVWVSSLISAVGYFYLLQFPFNTNTHLSPIAALLCFLLATAILFSKAGSGFLAPFSTTTETAKGNTKLLASGIILTIFFGWLRLQGELSGLFRHEAGMAIMGVAYILILVYSNRVSTIQFNNLEQKLKKEKELSEQIIKSLPAVFFVIDNNKKFIRFNDNLIHVSGYTKEELEKIPPDFFFVDAEKNKMDQYLKDINEKGMMTIEALLRDKEGITEPYFFKTLAIEYDGTPCIIGTGISIVEQKKAANEITLLNKQLRNLSNHLDNIREQERNTIAKEIHEELGQQLTVFKINLAWLKSLPKEEEVERENLTTEMLALTESMIHSIRRIAHDLRPPALEDLGLAEALRIYSDEFELRTGISVHFYTELDMLELSLENSKAFYRIYQESLTNIARYANAEQVEASFDLEENHLILSVSDNGVGFDTDELIDKKTMGIIGMRERAVMIGAKFEINSTPNNGTTVLVSLPLDQQIDLKEELML